ncbi:MAG: hypothetical protein GX424_01030 [Clostridiales bacterium]|nr:hypothetical protein [Clostridiales bacterium]
MDTPNNEELLSSIAQQAAKINLEHALAAFACDPKQISIAFETGKMGFDWRQKGLQNVFDMRSTKFSIEEYARAEASAAAAPQARETQPAPPRLDARA